MKNNTCFVVVKGRKLFLGIEGTPIMVFDRYKDAEKFVNESEEKEFLAIFVCRKKEV